MSHPTFRSSTNGSIPAVTADQMREVDRIAVEDIGLCLLMMMENAGRTLARHVMDLGDRPVRVVAGNGGNGGGGLACSRHLANHGVDVRVVLDRPPSEVTGAAARQLAILAHMDVPITVGTNELDAPDRQVVYVGALIGYGLDSDVRDPASGLIRWMNHQGGPLVSLDIPSGMDASTGEHRGAAIRPDRIVTLALPKTGLSGVDVPIYLADIGIPQVVYDRLDIPYTTPFRQAPTIEVFPA